MLRPARLLPPKRLSTPRSARRFSPTSWACYRALRCLPGWDLHPQDWSSFQDAPCRDRTPRGAIGDTLSEMMPVAASPAHRAAGSTDGLRYDAALRARSSADRASDFGSDGRGFESLRARQTLFYLRGKRTRGRDEPPISGGAWGIARIGQ